MPMFPAASAQKAASRAPLGRSLDQPSAYCPIPQRLITDLHDNPLAIGLYGFVARLYLVAQSPLALSVPDVLRYDPTLSRGAVLRALARLIGGGYLIEAAQPGLKTRYTPAWGRIGGAPLAWNMQQPCLGRPRHVARLRLDRRLFDICMGKLVPHATRAATITRYVTTPVVSLTDVGCYTLTLAGLPRATPALLRISAVRAGEACALPSDERLLALISQHALDFGDAAAPQAELTISGTRKLGMTPLLAPNSDAASVQPLFFVPPGMIGCLIHPMIGSMIGSEAAFTGVAPAAAAHELRSDSGAEAITWETRDQGDGTNPPPTPPQQTTSGGGGVNSIVQTTSPRTALPRVHPLPETEAARALQAINVKPAQIAELAHMPLTTVALAIADGRVRPGIRDLAGWVVSLLRTHRDYGWTITPPAPAPESSEALSAAFARYAAEQEAEPYPEMALAEMSDSLACAEDDNWRPAAVLAPPQSLVQLWNDVQATMQTRMTRQEFNTWIQPAVLQSVVDRKATISVPSARIKHGLEQRYSVALRELLTALLSAPTLISVVVHDECAVVQDHSDTAGMCLPSTDTLASTLVPEVDHRPAWISASHWSRLPTLLRAALIGSTVRDGAIQAISPHLTSLIAARYPREAVALIADAVPALEHVSGSCVVSNLDCDTQPAA
ncbi:MAG: DnaA N-terminal domain-containing protein [Roseiflexaceae bacterium]